VKIVNFVTEAVFDIDANGNVWAMAGFGDDLWSELLETFDAVRILARCRRVSSSKLTVRITAPEVELVALPYYHGPTQFLVRSPKILGYLKTALKLEGIFLLRLPGTFGSFLSEILRFNNRLYGVQLVGDPYEVLSLKGRNVFYLIIRYLLTVLTKRAVNGSSVINYVTNCTLQKRYPSNIYAKTFAFSDINLDIDWFKIAPIRNISDNPRLFLCGSLAQLYKGADLLIDAVALMRDQGVSVHAVIAGDGFYRSKLESQARDRDLGEDVKFLGTISKADVREELSRADIFVMPSRTEGMPRALIEAMAAGLPAVGANVGGIVELLDESYRFDVNNVEQFSKILMNLISDKDAYTEQSARNLEFSKKFCRDNLQPVRKKFYQALKDIM
jgi:glycosyltransferase involved in cell wall biosynthesis